MEYKLEIDQSLCMCVIKLSGIHKRPDDSIKLLGVAGGLAEKHACTRFLFDFRDATVLGGKMEAYGVVADQERHGLSKNYRVAGLYKLVTDVERFMEAVGYNRGYFTFRVFDDEKKAREWLTSLEG